MFYFVIFYCYLLETFLLSNETEREWIQMGREVGKKEGGLEEEETLTRINYVRKWLCSIKKEKKIKEIAL